MVIVSSDRKPINTICVPGYLLGHCGKISSADFLTFPSRPHWLCLHSVLGPPSLLRALSVDWLLYSVTALGSCVCLLMKGIRCSSPLAPYRTTRHVISAEIPERLLRPGPHSAVLGDRCFAFALKTPMLTLHAANPVMLTL